MVVRIVDGPTAWKALAGSPDQQWDHIADRFREPLFSVVHRPKFHLAATDRFFCIGSCFARNVEEQLLYRGVEVLSKRVVSPRSEWNARPNGMLNKFTTHSMAQELDWLVEPPSDYRLALLETAQGWRDMQLSPGLVATSLERALERRAYLASDYFPRLRDADVVIMTLGLNEVWLDRETGLRLNATPSIFDVRRAPDRFAVEITDVEENIAQLEACYRRLKVLNPGVRIVVTVSPVPMSSTFSGQDIAVANMNSKSTLRAAAEALHVAHDDVDYFPSYEMVSLTPRINAYGQDCLHVADQVVSHVIRTFLDLYVGALPAPPEGFTELGYFEANPDVEEAVRRAEFASGFEHWQRFGEAEGRPLAPPEPSQRMLAAGLV